MQGYGLQLTRLPWANCNPNDNGIIPGGKPIFINRADRDYSNQTSNGSMPRCSWDQGGNVSSCPPEQNWYSGDRQTMMPQQDRQTMMQNFQSMPQQDRQAVLQNCQLMMQQNQAMPQDPMMSMPQDPMMSMPQDSMMTMPQDPMMMQDPMMPVSSQPDSRNRLITQNSSWDPSTSMDQYPSRPYSMLGMNNPAAFPASNYGPNPSSQPRVVRPRVVAPAPAPASSGSCGMKAPAAPVRSYNNVRASSRPRTNQRDGTPMIVNSIANTFAGVFRR